MHRKPVAAAARVLAVLCSALVLAAPLAQATPISALEFSGSVTPVGGIAPAASAPGGLSFTTTLLFEAGQTPATVDIKEIFEQRVVTGTYSFSGLTVNVGGRVYQGGAGTIVQRDGAGVVPDTYSFSGRADPDEVTGGPWMTYVTQYSAADLWNPFDRSELMRISSATAIDPMMLLGPITSPTAFDGLLGEVTMQFVDGTVLRGFANRVTSPLAPIAEPVTLLLAGAGFGLVHLAARRRRRTGKSGCND